MTAVSRFRRHVTYANVVSTLALFLAVAGGTAFAASKMLDGRRLANGSVSGAKIADRTITITDLAPATRAALRGARGATGVGGASGRDGVAGRDGANGAAGAPGTNGTNGTNGTDGVPGSPVANLTAYNQVPCTPWTKPPNSGYVAATTNSSNAIVWSCVEWEPPLPQGDNLMLVNYGPVGATYTVPVSAVLANDDFPSLGVEPGAPTSIVGTGGAGAMQCMVNCDSITLSGDGLNIIIVATTPGMPISFTYRARVQHNGAFYLSDISSPAQVDLA